jgi:dCTP diphosphatase
MEIKEFQKIVSDMKKERDWHRFHQPKDLLLGLVEEISEFRNLIKWEQDPETIHRILVSECSTERREEILDYFGDTLWYLASLAEYCEVDMSEAMDKIVENHRRRFPISQVRGTTANPKTGGFDGKYVNEEGDKSKTED